MNPTDYHVVASVSGGKDSTAMALHLKEIGVQFTPVFIDTGWENRATYDYIRDYLPRVTGPITTISHPPIDLDDELEEIAQGFEDRLGHYSPMVRLVIKKGMFPGRRARFCTVSLKAEVIRDYLLGLDDDPINAVGIRGGESLSRSKMQEWEWVDSYDCYTWRPIIRYTEQDVIDIHARHGVKPNPNYLNGARRVGCWPCIYAAKKEIQLIAQSDPERIAIVSDLEKAVTGIAAKRAAEKDKILKYPRAWFQNPMPKKDPVTGKREGNTWPLDKVVQWAKTKRGGRQFELFMPAKRDQGCMRWGLCDMGEE